MKRFENKTILITGASSGIGLAGAKQLVAEGAKVIITGRTPSRLQAAAEELGANAVAVLDDAADGKTLERLLPVVERIGKLDGLWLNAAYAAGAPLEATGKSMIEQMFQVNVVAPMLQMGALSPHLNNGASVVVTSSSAVYEGQPNVALYAATKAAVLAAARSWAAELAPRGIRVNSLVPGPITSNLRSVLPDEMRAQFEEQLAEVVLLKRVGEAREAAAVALFLLSDDASYVTGSAYAVDGGLLMD
ncbi:SDR family NAD(P)-dependent oxidoreductase [Eikenella corrodens]|uniref:SDR family oxidoreductase n=1 Tax=Eikenella corrodens TaxID=539 RepID=A0A3S9SHB7_EIKCO|nr:SDR family oxidoreductase [Eikenella corrodens]AZR58859.1 SDR family oxidoreductase [Eikenella corrodens]